jgi:hypothetical protein
MYLQGQLQTEMLELKLSIWEVSTKHGGRKVTWVR